MGVSHGVCLGLQKGLEKKGYIIMEKNIYVYIYISEEKHSLRSKVSRKKQI